MRILGIDPGTRVAGYGVLDVHGSRSIHAAAAGVWRLGESDPLPLRLARLATELRAALARFQPQVLCVELSFLQENARSALFLGHARGVILSEGALAGLRILEVSPASAKKALCGHGAATKESVKRCITELLRVDVSKLPFDATDALAIAYAAALGLRHEALHGQMPVGFEPDPRQRRAAALQARGLGLALQRNGNARAGGGADRHGFLALVKARMKTGA